MATEIYQGIVAYQSGDSTAAWTLVQKFTPLLKHYAFILQEGVVTYIDDLSPFSSEEFYQRDSHQDHYDLLLLQDMKTHLTEYEYNVLFALYFEQRSVSAIASQLHKSRQAVNQAKNNALRKLRKI